MDEEILTTIGKKLVDVIRGAIQAGKSKEEAERAAAKAVERGDIVSDELYSRIESYIDAAKRFEEEGS